MTRDLHRIKANIIHHTHGQEAASTTAQVRLRYNFLNCGERVMLVRVECPTVEGERWRRTRRRIKDAAWDRLEHYFDGACLGSDQVNIFSGGAFDECADAKQDNSELSPEQEEVLQNELRQILLDFAA